MQFLKNIKLNKLNYKHYKTVKKYLIYNKLK